MAGLRRQKIALDDDPLAMLSKQDDADEEEEYEEPIKVVPMPKSNPPPAKPVEPLPLPASTVKGASGVLPEPPAKKKSIFDDEDDDLLIRKTPPPASISPPPRTDPVPAPLAVSPTNRSAHVAIEPTATSPKPKIVEFEGDDLFSYGIPQKETEPSQRPASKVSTSTNIAKSSVAKIDFNKDEEDISDLKVAQILEKEESLDYKLFGRVETSESVQQRVQKRLNDLDKEDDFLRQLDELTAKASAITTATSTTSSAASGPQSSTSPVNSSVAKSMADIDASSFDLNAYIAQESSGGGGLFDD